MLLNQRACALVFVTFLFAISANSNRAMAQTPTPTPSPTPAPVQAGQVIISELRLRGPAGAEDEFVELYNNTDQPITVQALDASGGWSVVISNGQITGPLFTIPNGTVIPARGHLLGANANGYSLGGYPSGNPTPTPPIVTATAAPVDAVVAAALPFATATADRTWDFDAADGSGVALFATTNGTNFTAATRLDAVGFTTSPALYKEGGGIPNVVTANTEHTYYRDLRNGTPRDTADNAADLLLVGTAPGIQVTRLGAPGPENLASPIVNNTTITATLFDPAVTSSSPPNRVRSFTIEENATFGTLLIRRTITNNTGLPVSRLRFRMIIINTLGTPASECPDSSCADLRALTSQTEEAVATSTGPRPVFGLRLEEPPAQGGGGGYNSSLSADFVTLGVPIAPGGSVNVVFKLGVMRTGTYRLFFNIEALNGASIILTDGPASGVGANGGTDVNNKRRLFVDTVRSAPNEGAVPASPAAPSATTYTVYAPLFINLTPTRAAEDEKDKDDVNKDDVDKEKKSEEAPPSAEPAPDASTDATDNVAPQSSPATTRRDPSKKLPAAAKARRDVSNQ